LAARRAAQQQGGSGRPFTGLAAECDLVALREFVPSAVAEARLVDAKRETRLVTVLPGAVAAVIRATGEQAEPGIALVATQVQHQSPDAAADLAAALLWAQTAEPGESLVAANPGPQTLAVREVLDPDTSLEIEVHQDFSWWFPPGSAPDPQVADAVERANAAVLPHARLSLPPQASGSAWWVDAGERAHLRWVRPEDEDAVMAALARLHAGSGLTLGDGSRFAGTLRTDGVLIPVFDLDRARPAASWTDAAAEFDARLRAAIIETPLTAAERRSRDGLRSRQLTLR
jgi:hypothetical protein